MLFERTHSIVWLSSPVVLSGFTMRKLVTRVQIACLMAVSLAGASSVTMAKVAMAGDVKSNETAHVEAATGSNVVAVINEDNNSSIFARILEQSGMAGILAGKGPFTVFMPTDAAFATLKPETIERLFEPHNKRKLAALVSAHVLPGRISSAQWNANPQLGIALGGGVVTYMPGRSERINNAPLVRKDIQATNGVVHVVGAPLEQPIVVSILNDTVTGGVLSGQR